LADFDQVLVTTLGFSFSFLILTLPLPQGAGCFTLDVSMIV